MSRGEWEDEIHIVIEDFLDPDSNVHLDNARKALEAYGYTYDDDEKNASIVEEHVKYAEQVANGQQDILQECKNILSTLKKYRKIHRFRKTKTDIRKAMEEKRYRDAEKHLITAYQCAKSLRSIDYMEDCLKWMFKLRQLGYVQNTHWCEESAYKEMKYNLKMCDLVAGVFIMIFIILCYLFMGKIIGTAVGVLLIAEYISSYRQHVRIIKGLYNELGQELGKGMFSYTKDDMKKDLVEEVVIAFALSFIVLLLYLVFIRLLHWSTVGQWICVGGPIVLSAIVIYDEWDRFGWGNEPV